MLQSNGPAADRKPEPQNSFYSGSKDPGGAMDRLEALVAVATSESKNQFF
jgi:hypothetical protein